METRNVKEVKSAICNADRPPTKHKTAAELSSFVRVFDLWDTPSAEENFDPTTDSYAKETDDYILCLETVRKTFKSNYVLIVEDDVVMKLGSLKTLKYFISNLETRHADDWIFLKLYYPKKWLGYSRELRTILELISSSILISSIITIVISLIKKIRSRSIIILQIFFSLIILPTFLILGRQTSVRWREISSSFHTLYLTPGCCTQAMLYNSKHISQLIEFLKKSRTNSKNPIDLLIDDYVKSADLRGYLVEPSLFDHIGFWSSFSNNKKDAIDFL
ncbi:hypothetical protein HELRODRAFT_80555 [Helobdella robusta]|uniref:Uncharacterized protein n=1 Tax=Helobdella robusta TaxID=6412 RepID=T1G420_HELRO|nr:hypothetical protein HELRODRAFT_80555 [Helobdella robusta]ESO03283.1 hypothetical protein HELRODRAFT_80555 [Helobdella robusta]